MSYRTVAHHALTVHYDGDADLARKLLDLYADDVRREAAEKIRAAGCQEVNWCGCPVAADLIDPGEGGEAP